MVKEVERSDAKLAQHWTEINKVAELYLQGETNMANISRQTGMSYAKVKTYMDEWRNAVLSDNAVRARARESLGHADKHYGMLIKEAWGIHHDPSASLGQKTAALKLASEIQHKQVEMLQKAGVISSSELEREMHETQEKQKVLVDILREIVYDCNRCKPLVYERMSKITGRVEEM